LGIGLASLWVIMGRKSERKTMEKDLDTLDNTLQDYNGTVEDEMKLYKAREKLYKEQKQQQSEYTDTLANLGDQAGDLDKKLSDLATRVRGWGKDTNEFWDKLVSGSGATAAAMDKVGESAKEMADKQKQAMEKVATEAKSFINTLKDIQQQEKDNTSEFIKSQAKRKQSFKENLTDMVYEAEQKRLAISKEIHLLDRKVKLTKEEKERRAELSEEVKKYYEEVAIGTKALGVGMPGALTPEMTAAATRGDIERYVGAYKSEQAGATVELGAEQEALQAGRRIGGTIFNFDFSNANITNIEQLKNDIIAAINRTNLLTEQGAM